jgi:hypothetical protein
MNILLFLALSIASASFESCGGGILSIHTLYADPLDRVASGQPIAIRFNFTVPQGVWIPSGNLHISTRLNLIPMNSWEEDLCSHVICPLSAGDHEVAIWQIFPEKVWGHFTARMEAMNESGTPLFCSRWSVWTV